MECGHGKSKHDPPQNPSLPPPPSSGLAAIFAGMTAKSSQPVSRKNARTEALGMKKAAKPSQLAKASTSTGDRKTSHGTVTSGRTFRVSSIAMLTCGLDSKGNLLDQKLPGGYRQKAEFLIILQNHGCLVRTQSHEIGYSIDTSWCHEEVTKALRGWFPKVFAHIDSRRELSSQQRKDKTIVQPDWQVLNCSQGHNFSVVRESFPTGQTLAAFKGRAKAGTTDSHLWLVTRNPVPDAVFDSWNTQMLVVGTDDETDQSVDDIQSHDGDHSSADDLIDLSSSFVDLGIEKSGTGKRPINLLSSPESGRAARKKVKSRNTSIPVLPLRLSNAGIPKVTPVLELVEVSETDQYLRGVIPYGDEKAPHMTSAWDDDFAFTPKLGNRNISDLCGL